MYLREQLHNIEWFLVMWNLRKGTNHVFSLDTVAQQIISYQSVSIEIRMLCWKSVEYGKSQINNETRIFQTKTE